MAYSVVCNVENSSTQITILTLHVCIILESIVGMEALALHMIVAAQWFHHILVHKGVRFQGTQHKARKLSNRFQVAVFQKSMHSNYTHLRLLKSGNAGEDDPCHSVVKEIPLCSFVLRFVKIF